MKIYITLLLIILSSTIYAQTGNWGLRQFETTTQMNAIFPSCAASSTAANISKLSYVNGNNTYYRWDCANSVWRPMADILITADAGAPSLTCSATTNFLVLNAAKVLYMCDGSTWQQVGTTVTTDATLAGNGSSGTPLKIAQQGASSGQVLKWNGSTWAPAADAGGSGSTDLSVGTITSTTLDVLSSSGNDATLPSATTSLAGLMSAADKTKLNSDNDQSATNELQTISTASNTVTLSNSGGSVTIAGAGTSTVATAGSTITVTSTEVDGSITNEGILGVGVGGANTSTIVSNTSTATGVTLSGSANISVTESTSSNGGTITLDIPLMDGKILVGNGSNVAAAVAPSGDLTTTNTGVFTVDKIDNTQVVATGATTNQILKWNGSSWVPATDATGSTNLTTANNTSTTIDVLSDTGTDATIPAATTSLAGLMTAADKTKLGFVTITQPVDLDAVEAASHAAVSLGTGSPKLTLSGQQLTLSDVNDADADPTNEALTIFDGTNSENLGGQTLTVAGSGGITPTYDIGTNTLTISASGLDPSITNEGALSVGAGASNTSTITSNTSGSSAVTIGVGTGMTITENTGTRTITLNVTDQSEVNEGTLTMGAGGANTTTITSNTSGSGPMTFSGATNINVTENTGTSTLTIEAALPDGTVYVGNSSGIAQSRTMSGDASTTNTGVVTVDKVDNTQVLATGATNGQVMAWSTTNSRWEPTNAATGTVTSVAGTAGAGISITGSPITTSGTLTITNTGDTDASDDITTSTVGIGDIDGNFPDLTVVGLQGSPIAAATPTTGQVLKWNGTAWSPDADATGGAGSTDLSITNRTSTTLDVASSSGIDATVPEATTSLAGLVNAADKTKLSFTTITQAVDLDAVEAASHAAATVSDNARLDFTLTGQQITADLAQNGATSGQVYKWNGTVWAPATDNNTTYTAGSGIDVTGTVISNTGDLFNTNEGALAVSSGTSTTSVITSNTSGSTNITLNAGTGMTISENTGTNNITLTNASPDQTVSITGAGISAVTGTYPNFTITSTEVDGSITNEGSIAVGAGGANTSTITSNTSGSPTVTLSGATNMNVTESGNTITVEAALPDGTMYLGNSSNIAQSRSMSGDATITNTGVITVDKVDNTQVLATGATNGQVLKWSTVNSRWEPAADAGTSYTAGAGIDITGPVISNTGIITEVDGNISNEGQLSLSSGTSTTTILNSNTVGATSVTINAGTGLTISENTGTNNITLTNSAPDQTVVLTGAGINAVTGTYPSFTITGTEVDGSTTNELQTIIATSDATSHTETLSSTGGSIKLVEGSGITLTTTGTSADAIVTIASTTTGTTDLTITGSSSPLTLNSSSGTDVTLTAGTGVTLSGASGNATITNSAPDQTVVLTGAGITAITGTYPSFTVTSTEVDGNISNEGSLAVNAGTSTTSVIASNTSGSTNITLNAGTGLSISENTGTNNITLTNSLPDQTVSITGAGISSVTGTYPNFTVTSTEVDGSTTNELQTIANTSDATSHTSTLSNSGGSTQFVEGSGITLTTSGTGLNGIVTIASTATGTTNLTVGGTSSPLTIESSSGSDMTVTAGTGISLSGSSTNMTINNTGIITEVDGSTTNELQTLANTSDATSHTGTLSNSGGSMKLVEGTGIGLTTTGTSLDGIITVVNTAPDQTVSITGAGINVTTGTYPNFTVTGTEVDGSISNEGSLTVGAGTGTTSIINSNTTGSTGVTVTAGTGLAIAEIGNVITLTNSSPDQTLILNGAGITSVTGTYPNFSITSTEVDGSTTNELQTIANTSNSTTHTATLSNSGGSLQLAEGSGITLTTTGTGLDGIVTIASTSTGATNLAVSGTSSPLTLTSDTGTDVTFTAGTGVSLTGTSGNVTINNTGIITEVDGSLTNEVQTLTIAGTTSPTVSLNAISGTGGGTATFTGAGITALSQSGGTITITSTEVDGSTTNELQTVANTSDATSHTVTLSNSGGSTQFVEGSGITLTTTGTSGAGVVTIASTGTLPSLANNNIWVGNASNVATAVNPSGDADVSNTGVFTVDRVDNIDVQATGATDLQLMRWDNTNNKWKPTNERTQTIELTGTSNPEISLTGNDGTSGGGNTILVTGQRGITVDNNSGVMDISLPATGVATRVLTSDGTNWFSQTNPVQAITVSPTSGLNPNLTLTDNAGGAGGGGVVNLVGTTPIEVVATGSTSIGVKLKTTGAVDGDVIKYQSGGWTIAADATGSGGTNLAISGSSSPLTLTSDTGTDVTLTAGSGISLAGTSGNATITATDPSLSNEGALTVTQPFSTQIAFHSNTSSSTDVIMQALSDSGIELTLGSPSAFRINMIKVLREETFTATASQTAFTMSYSAPAVSGTAYPLRVFRNGVELDWVASAPNGTQYTFSGTTLTTAANVLNDVVRVNYFN